MEDNSLFGIPISQWLTCGESDCTAKTAC